MNVLSSLEVWEVSRPDLRPFPGHNTDFVLHLPPSVINKREKAYRSFRTCMCVCLDCFTGFCFTLYDIRTFSYSLMCLCPLAQH